MNTLLGSCTSLASAYMDDLAVYSSSWEDHLRHLMSVLKELQKAGLTAKLAKCQFRK